MKWFKKRKSNNEIFTEIGCMQKQIFMALTNIRELRLDVIKLENLVKSLHLSAQDKAAAMAKTLSSIEMEMLLARGASLDNNFEGKENL